MKTKTAKWTLRRATGGHPLPRFVIRRNGRLINYYWTRAEAVAALPRLQAV